MNPQVAAPLTAGPVAPRDPDLALQDAKLRLLADKPFYGFVVSRFPAYAHSRLVPVAAVVMRGPVITLHTNPDVFPYLPLRVRMQVLEHEVLHLLHRHIPLRPGLDPDLWNLSTDLSINTLMKPNHPDYEDPDHPERSILCLLPERLSQEIGVRLPDSGDAEMYYNLLIQDREKHGGGKIIVIVSPDGKHKALAREGDPRLGEGWKVYDLHPNFRKGQDPSDDTGQVPGDLPQAEIIEGEIRSIIEEATKLAGSVPSELQQAIDKLFKPRVDWRRVLRRFAGSVLSETVYRTWVRPNRRLPVWPGVRHEPGAHLAAIIDTSGSMSDAELAAIGSELYQISKLSNMVVDVAEVDAEVHRTYRLTTPTLKTKMRQGFMGRGGTVFRPGFEWAARQKVDGIVYFTDGYNYDRDWLERYKPPCPVLWVITHNGEYPAQWGWRIKLPPPGEDS